MHRINVAQYPWFAQRLKRDRARSVRMQRLFLRPYKRWLKAGGRRVGGAYEWPRNCDGWKQSANPCAAELERTFPMACDFDGCRFNLRYRNQLLKKPWRIRTDHKCVKLALHERFCLRNHRHAPSIGSAARHSENYPRSLAISIAHSLAKPVP